MSRRRASTHRQAGFAFIVAIFLLVILAGFAAFAVSFVANANATTAVAVHGARAYQAARAGIEWAAYRLNDPNGTLSPGATNLPACFGSTALSAPAGIGNFSVTVSCTRHPGAGSEPDYHEEGAQRSAFYVVTSTATAGTPGSADYVERRIQARIEVCKDAAAAAPTYACAS
jgi:MSHA biogenesis protein MshP